MTGDRQHGLPQSSGSLDFCCRDRMRGVPRKEVGDVELFKLAVSEYDQSVVCCPVQLAAATWLSGVRGVSAAGSRLTHAVQRIIVKDA